MHQEAYAIVGPVAVSAGVPLSFLYGVRRLDLYATGSFALVVFCLAAGAAAFPAALAVNSGARLALTAIGGATSAQALLVIRGLIAPVTEEALKALGLAAAARHASFTYFVDGAVCGFASGTGFAVVENAFYLDGAGVPGGLALGIGRAFSTSLMHAASASIVGVAIGRARFGARPHRMLMLGAGVGVASGLHALFNFVVAVRDPAGAATLAPFAIGLSGVALTAGLIRLGLREEREWLRRSLALGEEAMRGEAAVVHRLADLRTLLRPVETAFGTAKREQVESLLRLEARWALRQHARLALADSRGTSRVDDELVEMQAEIGRIRRGIGMYCMAFVRSILPPETQTLWSRLCVELADDHHAQIDIYSALASRTTDDRPAGDAPSPVDGATPARRRHGIP